MHNIIYSLNSYINVSTISIDNIEIYGDVKLIFF